MGGRARALGVVLAILCSTSAFPMEPARLTLGSRVRITAPPLGAEPLIGTLVGIEPEALLVRREKSDEPMLIPVSSVTRLEASGGRKTQAGRGAMIGAAVGVMPGLALTFGDYNSVTDPSPAAVAAVGAAGGAALGAAIGWAVKSEEWLPAEMPAVAVGIAPLRGGGMGVSVRVAWGKGRARVR
jgi:hypothetical protein